MSEVSEDARIHWGDLLGGVLGWLGYEAMLFGLTFYPKEAIGLVMFVNSANAAGLVSGLLAGLLSAVFIPYE